MPAILFFSCRHAGQLAILIDIVPAQLAAENWRAFLESTATRFATARSSWKTSTVVA
jgi:hypothetical protein